MRHDRSKRFADCVLGLAALLLALPFMALVALALRCTQRGPILYRQTRVGLNGRPFTLLKFCTMVEDPRRPGPAVTAHGDPRVTRLGRLLRRLKLNELPQLFNVLRGDMSLVGPRPELPAFVATYREEQLQLLSFRPGLTDPASIAFRDEDLLLAAVPPARRERHYAETILPVKARIQLDYLERANLALDLAVLLRTVASVFASGGASLHRRRDRLSRRRLPSRASQAAAEELDA